MLDVFKINEKREIEEGCAKRNRTKQQTTIYKTLHRIQIKDRTTRNPIKPDLNSGAPEGKAVPGQHVTEKDICRIFIPSSYE